MKATALAAITSLLLLGACSDRYSAEQPDGGQIRITADLQEIGVPTKATFHTDLNQENARMKVYGYKTGTTTMHFSSPAIYYGGNWLFYNNKARDVKYYWPDATHGLDFFAYYPEPLSTEKKYYTHVTVSDTPCSAANTFTFSCADFPVTTAAQDSTVEFVCAYKENILQPASNEKHAAVGLEFQHPFARVSFQLTSAIRSDIKTVSLTNIYNNGTCTVTDSGISWATSGDRTSLVGTVNKKYPEDINNGGIMGGPYIIIPQTITDESTTGSSDPNRVQLVVAYNSTTVSVDLRKAAGQDAWLPGNDYTYSLTLNGAANEVILSVEVTPWTEEGSSQTDVK